MFKMVLRKTAHKSYPQSRKKTNDTKITSAQAMSTHGTRLWAQLLGRPKLSCARLIECALNQISILPISNFVSECECILQISNDLASLLCGIRGHPSLQTHKP